MDEIESMKFKGTSTHLRPHAAHHMPIASHPRVHYVHPSDAAAAIEAVRLGYWGRRVQTRRVGRLGVVGTIGRHQPLLRQAQGGPRRPAFINYGDPELRIGGRRRQA